MDQLTPRTSKKYMNTGLQHERKLKSTIGAYNFFNKGHDRGRIFQPR